ncbi:MAG: polysaccharide deacetylase family protein [Nitrospirae bacterium]|nr:polysaccharide deacetylase family protein [Candidatus Troglogloeales bacterium]
MKKTMSLGDSKMKWVLSLVVCFLLAGGTTYGQAEGVPILIYHEILNRAEEPGETKISLDRFKEQMKYLYEHHYATISVDELVNFMKGERSIPKKSVLLTFDDGWKSGLNAVPVLEKYHFKAVFFIFPGKGIGEPYMEWNDVLALAKNPRFQICSHTMSHPWDKQSNLVTWLDGKPVGKDKSDVMYELQESKKELEKRLDKKVNCFAWPVGWYNEALIEMAKDAGYEALFTAEDGSSTKGGDLLRIKRTFVDGACNMTIFKQTLQNPKYHVCQTKNRTTQGHSPYD